MSDIAQGTKSGPLRGPLPGMEGRAFITVAVDVCP
jgi:hypothetical protein